MLNISELTCRVCLQQEDVLINVYDELEDSTTNLSNLLEKCADLKIYEVDPFPKYLCENCTRELLITSKFREKCDKSKEILSEMLEYTKIVDFEELSNSSDLIEYCSDGVVGDDGEISNLIVQEFDTLEENVLADDSEPVRQLNPTENIKSIELIKQPFIQTLIAEPIPNNILLETMATTYDCCNSTIINTEELSQPHLFNKKQIEKPKVYNIFKCDICGAHFKQAVNLQKHLQKSHETDHCFICNKCSHCFSLETEFHKHIENCIYVKTISEKNSVYKTLNTDFNNKQNSTLETECTRQCIYCERTFPTPFALRMHLRTHTGERPFQCKYCTKSFKTQAQLNVHHKRHTGQSDFICTLCNKSFYEQSNLSVHMRSHTGERPHACSICNKTFGRVFLLQFHMRTHTGEKPFQCNFCDKSFRQHTDLRNHLTIHTGKKQHTCNLCGKSYIKRSHLVQHMSKHQVHINTAETMNTSKFEQDQKYLQNSEVLYCFNGVIENGDIDLSSDKFG